MCWWAFATALLYIAAVFIVLFCDTRADLVKPTNQLTMWGWLKSWIKHTAMYRFLWQLLLSCWTLLWMLLRSFGSWFKYMVQPKKPPDPNYFRRKRYQEMLLY